MKQYVNVALVSGEKVLMQLRDNIPHLYEANKWHLPGGGVEGEESLANAMIREFKEETGYTLKNPQLVNTLIMPYEKGDYALHVFTELYDGKQKIECYEGQQMKFLSLRELRTLAVGRKNIEIIEELFAAYSK